MTTMGTGYRELRPPRELADAVVCLWDDEWDDPVLRTIVPDGCVDLIWLDGRLVVDGPDTGPRQTQLLGRASGIRFRAGAAASFLGVPTREVCDLRVSADDLWGRQGARWQAELATAAPGRRHDVLAAAVAEHGATPDPLVRAAIPHLASPEARVATVASALGVSERQLHRRMADTVGYGPKTFLRVARLRRLMRLPAAPLAQRAVEAGYASQAHMNAEVRRLTGETPVRFLKDSGPVPT